MSGESAGEGILAPIKATDHFVSMYWIENGFARSMEFRVSAGDTKALLAELRKPTGTSAENVQELAATTQKLIKEQFARSPVVQIERKVTLALFFENQISPSTFSLAPGNYHLVVLPRENHSAEVYFLEGPAYRENQSRPIKREE